MGTRTARLLAFSASLLALACSDPAASTPPATDRFYYPTGLAVRHVDKGGAHSLCLGGAADCHTQLFVASSNFDLRFDGASGGTVMAVDVDAALRLQDPAQPPRPLLPASAGGAQLGLARMGSFAGELAILDGNTCPGFAGAEALVASRSQNALYRLSIGSKGELSCGAGCVVPLDARFGDPYGVTVACGDFRDSAAQQVAPQQYAFVSYLRTPSSEGELSRIDLAAPGSPRTPVDLLSVSPAHGTVFDPSSTRLYVTQRFGAVGSAPLRWFSLATLEVPSSKDVFSLIRGAELRGLALSSESSESPPSPPSRVYLALRIYDADAASAVGIRPSGDVAGALAVMDLTPRPGGEPAARLLNVVPIDRGASEIRVVPRRDPATKQKLRDLVAVTCTDDNTLALYDDETGAIAKVFDICGGVAGEPAPPPCAAGNPLTGKQPFGLAVEPLANGNARLYVGSFDRSWVNVIEIDPLNPAAGPVQGPPAGKGITGAAGWARIGPERL